MGRLDTVKKELQDFIVQIPWSQQAHLTFRHELKQPHQCFSRIKQWLTVFRRWHRRLCAFVVVEHGDSFGRLHAHILLARVPATSVVEMERRWVAKFGKAQFDNYCGEGPELASYITKQVPAGGDEYMFFGDWDFPMPPATQKSAQSSRA